MCDQEFLKMLRTEMLEVRRSRFQCHLAKVTAIGAQIGASVVLTERLHTYMLFYVVPFVAVAYDLFALGESFTMRRMHKFAKGESGDIEKRWEEYVSENPNSYTTYGNLGITVLCIVGCGTMIWKQVLSGPSALLPVILATAWTCSLLVILVLIWLYRRKILTGLPDLPDAGQPSKK